jgi:PAS domain S-box-containing protein
MLSPNARDSFKEELVAIAEGKAHFELESTRGTQVQGYTHIVIKWAVVPGHEDTWANVLVSIFDVTERKRAEAALKESLLRQTALLDNIPDLAWLKDQDSRFIAVNEPFGRSCGVPPQDLVGKNDLDIWPEELARSYRADDREVMRSRARKRVEERLVDHEGNRRWIETIKTPILDASGEVLGTVGIARDITERKWAEEALRESERRFREMLENVQLVAVMLDAQGNITFCNDSLLDLTGWQREEVLGQNWFDTFMPPPQVERMFRETIVQGAVPTHFENEICTRQGDRRLIVWNNTVLRDVQGEVIGTASIGEDITERKRAEAEREALIRELEAKNAELERFAYTASHDLKSPLITIKGFLGFLGQDLLAGNVERMKADLGRIANAADKMEQLLDELLELSRIGRLVNPPERVSFGELAREAVSMIAGRLAQRGVQVDIAPDLPVVYGDRHRLREALQNLVDNAAKFMGEQPDPRVEIGVRLHGDQAVFYVRDNGMGIDPRYHDKVFGLFEKLDTKSEGSGIGLAIVKRIVEVHGGRVWVESEGLGQGSLFCFTLPGSRVSANT